MSREEIVFSSAKALARRIRDREISAREVMIAHIEQIEQINPTVNAIVSMLNPEVAIERANEADRQPCDGPLHGLPTAFKDLEDAVGFPNTQGSPIFADFYPEQDSVIVERLKNAGAIPIGKTNVPEFGLGSHTYNNVFGPTRNPWNLDRTAGGSSGGAAVALATGMLPIADGSDMGGSLRNPGNFNNVVGFRVSAGLVPKSPSSMPWATNERQGTTRPLGGGCRLLPLGYGRVRPARPALVPRRRGGLRRRPDHRSEATADCLEHGSRRVASRSGRSQRGRWCPGDVRGDRLRCRGGPPRFHRCRQMFKDLRAFSPDLPPPI